MLAKDIRDMGESDIRARIAELEEEQFRLRFRGATEPLEDPLRVRVVRRTIARLKTILHEHASSIHPVAAKMASTGAARKPAAKGTRKTAAATKAAGAKKPARTTTRRTRG